MHTKMGFPKTALKKVQVQKNINEGYMVNFQAKSWSGVKSHYFIIRKKDFKVVITAQIIDI